MKIPENIGVVEEVFWEKGYNDQCWGYPILDHAWDKDGKEYPKQYQEFYRQGQVQAYHDGKAKKPWFAQTKQLF